MATGQLFINGTWRAPLSGETYSPINPANEEPVAEVGKGTSATSTRRWRRPARPSTRGPGRACRRTSAAGSCGSWAS